MNERTHATSHQELYAALLTLAYQLSLLASEFRHKKAWMSIQYLIAKPAKTRRRAATDDSKNLLKDPFQLKDKKFTMGAWGFTGFQCRRVSLRRGTGC